jgi:hypothetical protein
MWAWIPQGWIGLDADGALSEVESVGPEALVRRTRVKRFCWQVSGMGWKKRGWCCWSLIACGLGSGDGGAS